MLPEPGDTVCAGLDMGLRTDSSALVIVHSRNSIMRVAELVEMRPQPDAPLKPSHVVRKFAEIMLKHRCSYAVGDQFYRESVVEYLDEYGLVFTSGPTPPSDAYVRARTLFREGRVRMPRHPRLIRQLRETAGVPTSGGRISIQHPRTSNGGHGDIVAALVLALWQLSGDTVAIPEPTVGTREWEQAKVERRRKRFNEQREMPEWMPKAANDRGVNAWWKR